MFSCVSDHEQLQEPLEWFIAHHFNHSRVVLQRTNARLGLIQARLYGVQFAHAQTITFLDAHCECVEGT